MPYASNADIPPDVRKRFTESCQTVWRTAWNDTYARHGDEGRAFATAETAGQSCMEAKKAMSDHALKFVGPDTVEGLAIPFGSPDELDLDGEFFTKSTDLCLEWFGGSGRPLLYDHGLDAMLKSDVVGRQTDYEMRDEGVWVQSQLDRAGKYRKVVDRLIEEGALGYSSGAMPHLAEKKSSGEITRWPWVELSMTPIPAHPATVVHYVKSSDAIRHMEDAHMTVPAPLKAALKALDDWADERGTLPAGEPFADNADRVLADVKAISDRFGAIAAMRAKSGRTVSRANWERVRALADQAKAVATELDSFLSEYDPDAETKAAFVLRDRAVADAYALLALTS